MAQESATMPSVVRSLCASLPLLLATTAAAQSIGDWRSIPSRTVPPARSGHVLVELPTGDLMMFGGDAANPNATEWLWDGFDWSPATTAVPRRDHAAAARMSGTVLVYGGVANGQILSDAYITGSGIGWGQVPTPIGPLTDVSLAGDEANTRFVLVGKDLTGTWQTWTYQQFGGAGWSQGPSFQALSARVVGDTLRRRVLLLSEQFNAVDVAVLDGLTWQPYAQSTASVELGDVTFDPRRGNAIVLQPFDDLPVVEWDGLAMNASGSPAGTFLPPASAAMAWHSERDEVVLVVNRGNGLETLRHAVSAPANAAPFGAACGRELELAANSMAIPGATHYLTSDSLASDATVGALGFSRTMSGGQALPQTFPGGCLLEVDPAIPLTLGANPNATLAVMLPNSPMLLGERYDAQFVGLDSAGSIWSTNGLEVQVGQPLAQFELVESFQDESNRDPLASGDGWALGATRSAMVGGDGRHGSFDLSIATMVEPGVYELDTGATTIPAERTLTGQAESVVDGRFFFTDFVVPAGATLRFVGESQARVYVRGTADIQGTVTVDAPDMPSVTQTAGPATGLQVSTFQARTGIAAGQPGGPGGPGGAAGGRGGNECLNQGPILVNGVDVTSGANGEDVLVAAGHAYGGSVNDTGGAGSLLMPPSGVWSVPFPNVGNVYSAYFSRGGNGGGFYGTGGVAATPSHFNPINSILTNPATAASPAFPLFPIPPGTSSLEHFTVGGSGGGGGGSHGYGLLAIGTAPEKWMAGHGGAGGGGVLVVRAGGRAFVSGELSAQGGSGPIIAGDDPTVFSTTDTYGISSPGGGGSGGSILLQAAAATFTGHVDVSGGTGGVNGFMVNTLQSMTGGGGDGASGFYRIETEVPFLFQGSASLPFSVAENRGALTDEDDLTGSRSLWMVPSSAGLPTWLHYELLVQVNGLPVLFSDVPEVSPLFASGPSTPATLRVQGCRVDANGDAIEHTIGPWRPVVRPGPDSVNGDFAQAIRFDVVLDKSLGAERVLELRIVWR